ncbi:MAG: DUF4271 domain-containing protein [Desulfovibrionaceae bacterium]|nr:DUF4271 domain-containing protein [Desulfovibrionaceae bacterium]
MPELFSSSTLRMSTVPLSEAAGGMLWGDFISNRIALIAALALLVVELQDILRLYPALLRCVPLWKGNLELEHSVSQARTRNTVALVMAILFCILADRFSLFDPSWRALAAPWWQLGITAGIIAGAVLLRRLLYVISPFRSKTGEFACTVRHSLYNYFILYATLSLISGILASAFGAPDSAVRIVLVVEAAAVWFLHLLRTGQILASRYGVFATFLYLCALEILPAGILILTCTR